VIILGLDTSTPVASAAIADGERVFERAEPVTTFSERLLPLLDALFAEAGLRPASLSGIACAAGPGSFTGLRIGLATAKGLCLATGAPLVLVPSLEALALGAPAGARVVSAIDAYRGEIYVGRFAIDGDGVPHAPSPDRAAFALAPAALADACGDEPPSHYAGDGFDKHPSAIPVGAIPIARGGRTIARAVLELGRRRLLAGQHDDPRRAAPLYVRPPAAEEKRRSS
jgi:tRNA threonylcarbamoyladenosine biosynthesis protein TsaB